jgi:hypothetical protein
MNKAFRQYAIAGVLHMDHLADMAGTEARSQVRRHATTLGPARVCLGKMPRKGLSHFE